MKPGQSGEIWLSEAIGQLIQKRDVYAVELKNSRYYDCGNKLEYLKAVVELGLKHEDLHDDFSKFLKDLKF